MGPGALRGLATERSVEIVADLLLLMKGTGPAVGIHRTVRVASGCRKLGILVGPVAKGPTILVPIETPGVLKFRLTEARAMRGAAAV